MRNAVIGGKNVSKVGLGGHYKRMEEGIFEERTAEVGSEAADRRSIVRESLTRGITYFDTTWKNEVELLSTTLDPSVRDNIWINGMVLGAFTGSAHYGITSGAYFDKWLDYRMSVLPGGKFDSVMINAIEEGFDEGKCEELVSHLIKRRDKGDFSILGFSTHNPRLARRLLDDYPDFGIAMLPYNFRNRVYEDAFAGYAGGSSIVAMKPLVWTEYGIPFCSVNTLPAFRELFGFEPDMGIQAKALRFILGDDRITVALCAANALGEVAGLADAGEGSISNGDVELLARYNEILGMDSGIPLFVGGLLHDNLRMNFFACSNLAKILGIRMPHIPLNEVGSRDAIMGFARSLAEGLKSGGYGRYLQGTDL